MKQLLQEYSDTLKVGDVFPIQTALEYIRKKDMRVVLNNRMIVHWLRTNGYVRNKRLTWVKTEKNNNE